MNIVGLEAGAIGFQRGSHESYRLRSSTFAQITATSAMLPEVIQHLLTIENVFFANFSGARAHARRDSSRSFQVPGESEAAELFRLSTSPAATPCFVLSRCRSYKWDTSQRRLHADEAAHSGVPTFELLGHQSVLNVTHPSAAVSLERGAEESEVSHRPNQFTQGNLLWRGCTLR